MRDLSPYILAMDEACPCGPNLEYDSAFLALERLATPDEERGVGATVRQAQEPDWRDVARMAETLALRTRDLRVVLCVAQAWLALEALPAMADGLAVVQALLEQHWEHVHPCLDDGDPTERINALALLGADPGILGHLRRCTVIAIERVGVVTQRDLRTLAETASSTDDDDLHKTLREHVATVFGHAGHSRLQEIDAVAVRAIGHLEAIGQVFAMHTPGRGPDIEPCIRELGILRREVQAYLPMDSAQAPACVSPSPENEATDASPADAVHRLPRSLDADEIRHRLDEICQWYAANEPASPVPVILRRARGLIGLDFTSLLEAVAPGGLTEFRSLAGED